MIIWVPILRSIHVLRLLRTLTVVRWLHARLHGERLGAGRVGVVCRAVFLAFELDAEAYEHFGCLGRGGAADSGARPTGGGDGRHEVDLRGVFLGGVENVLVVLLLALKVE
jgi:hypothetical protein